MVPRIAFVSGGMGGIGSAICRRLGAPGHTVVAGCLPGYEKKAEWLERMRTEGFRVHAAEGDVADFESCAEMFYSVPRWSGRSTSWSTTPASRATRCSSA